MKYKWYIIHSYVSLPEGTKQLMFVSRGEIVVCCDVVRICSPWLSLFLGGKLRMARGILRYPASRQTPDIWPNLSTQTTNQGHLPVSCVALLNAGMDLNRKTMMGFSVWLTHVDPQSSAISSKKIAMDSPSELEGAVSPTASLRSDLEGELLRAVRLELCLAGWGRHFSQSKEAARARSFWVPQLGQVSWLRVGKCVV
jgi:hypothetical protein